MAPFLVSCGRLVLRSDSLSQMLHEVVVSLFCLTRVPNLQACKLHRSGLSLFTEVNNCHAACANYLRIVRFRIIKSSNCKWTLSLLDGLSWETILVDLAKAFTKPMRFVACSLQWVFNMSKISESNWVKMSQAFHAAQCLPTHPSSCCQAHQQLARSSPSTSPVQNCDSVKVRQIKSTESTASQLLQITYNFTITFISYFIWIYI